MAYSSLIRHSLYSSPRTLPPPCIARSFLRTVTPRPGCAGFHSTLSMPSAKEHKRPGKYSHLPLSTSGPIDCAVTGTVLLNTPYFNRGSAHTLEERDAFNLSGLLPQSVQTLEQQVTRAYQQYITRRDDIAKNTFLTSLKEQNLVLYFRVRHFLYGL